MLLPCKTAVRRIRSAELPPSGSGCAAAAAPRLPGQRRAVARDASTGPAIRPPHATITATSRTTHHTAITTSIRRPPQVRGVASIVGPACCCCRSSAATIFVAMRGAGELHAPFVQRYFSWMPVGRSQDRRRVPARSALDGDDAGRHRRRHADPPLQRRLHAGRPGYARYFAYLNLFVFFMLVLVLGAQLPGAVRRLGRRRTLLVPADRVLVQRQGQRRRGQEGVHREPHRRLRLPGRDVPDCSRTSARSTSAACARAASALAGRRRASSPRSACSCSSAAPARARRFRCTSGCPTPWPARRRSRR